MLTPPATLIWATFGLVLLAGLRVAFAHRIGSVEASAIDRPRVRARRRPYKHRIAGHLFELAVAASWLCVGLAWLPSPTSTAEHSPVGRNVGVFATCWSSLFIIGGIATIWGVLRSELGVRVSGLVLLATGLAMEFVAAVTFDLTPRALVYLVYFGACAARALMLTLEHRRGT